mmetsp:Transcript_734/g.1505  ORF Transcript_734/g.1505 Transcript_734/m.1505 type:complete len:152 (+) Transcript_734:162-617(+)
MVWNRIRDAIYGPPQLEGPSILPPYFPVEPAGCEKHAQNLFQCIAKDATERARDMEKMGYGKSYYSEIEEERLKKLKEDAGNGERRNVAEKVLKGKDVDASKLPKPDDNPLDECRTFIAYYKRCCDRELKKKKNWILTEPYRVQEEYRYKK